MLIEPKARALLSVTDKSGIVDFATGLNTRGVEIISTGGTARVLDAGDVPVIGVKDFTQVPEMMDGRVKTLHHHVFAGIMHRRGHAGDLEAMIEHGIRPIDIVVCNLYDFAGAASDPNATEAEIIEQIDIGGPSIVRAAVKNLEEGVIVVVDPADYDRVLAAMDENCRVPRGLRVELAGKAMQMTALFDATVALRMAALHGTSVDSFLRQMEVLLSNGG